MVLEVFLLVILPCAISLSFRLFLLRIGYTYQTFFVENLGHIYQTRVRSLGMLVSDSLTD